MEKVNGADLFEGYAQLSSELMQILMSEEFKPEIDKTLKKWNMAEVASLFDVTSTYLKKLIDEKKIPAGQLDGSRRMFSLSEIHRIREYLGELNPDRHGKLGEFRKKGMCQIVGVSNFKGGVGKSTTTVTLAHDLCLRGWKVLVVDLDGQGSTTTLFGYIPNEDISGENTIEPFIERYHPANRFDFQPQDLGYCIVETHWENLDLIPSNLDVGFADIALSGTNITGYRYWEQLKIGLDTVKDNYDVILLDFPPSLGYLAINGIYASDSLLIPLPPDMLDFSSASAFFNQLFQVSHTLESETDDPIEFEFVKILMTKCEKIDETTKGNVKDLLKDRKQREAKRMLGYMASSFQDGVLHNEILRSDAIKEAARRYKSVLELEPSKVDCTRATLKRCLESVQSAHDEIEQLMLDVFSSRLERLED